MPTTTANQVGMDMLIMGAVNQTAQISSSLLKAACSRCLCLQMTSSDAKDLYSSKWKRFSAFTIGTLTMSLTCLLYLVSAICAFCHYFASSSVTTFFFFFLLECKPAHVYSNSSIFLFNQNRKCYQVGVNVC